LPELPNFKASFGSLDWQIPIVLDVVGRQAIRSTRSVGRELFSEFVRLLKGQGRAVTHWSFDKEDFVGETYTGRKASKKFLIVQIYSLALPGATYLDLISKQENLIMLTFYGSLLHEELKKSGSKTITSDPKAKQILNRIVLELDKKWSLISCVEQLGGLADTKSLMRCLTERGVKIPTSTGQTRRNVLRSIIRDLGKKTNDKGAEELLILTPQTEEAINSKLREKSRKARESSLRQLLNLYSNLGLLRISRDRISMNTGYLETLQKETNYWKTDREIGRKEFFESLLSSYATHCKHRGEMVAIPILRHDVCRELDIPWDSFDRKFVDLGYEFEGKRIGLARAIFSKKWGISVGTANYYYVSSIGA
jgi:hypothetical protein